MKAMAAARPGSARWLIQHELRLAWRGSASRRVYLAVPAALWLALHVGVFMLFQRWSGAAGALPSWTMLVLGGATWAVIGLMLVWAISGSVSALFDRGDLDLLLSSPLPTRIVFIARGLGVAADVARTLLFLLAPVANVGVLFGFWNLLAIYLTLPALALGVTALGMGLSLVLVRLLGARRVHLLSQILATVVSAALFLSIQWHLMLDANGTGHLVAAASRWAEPGGPLAPNSLLWFPSRAMEGVPLPLLLMLVAGPGAFWLIVHLTHRRFLAGTQESVTGSAVRTVTAPGAGTTRFSAGLWRTVLLKEWRLIRRDPRLISQTLTQLVFMVVPLAYLTVNQRAGSAMLATMLGPAIVFFATLLAGSLAWITVAAEDVPELLRSAPASPSQLRWVKALAALVPVWLLAVPALVLVAKTNLWSLPALMFCLAGSTFATAAAQVWYPTQAKRTDMARRRPRRGVVSLIVDFVTFAWVALAFCLVEAPAYAPPALLAATLGSGAIWLLGRARRADEVGDIAINK